MKLIPFLEAVEDYRKIKNLKKVEKKISLIEAAAATQVAHVFRKQVRIIKNTIPQTFTETDLKQAADKAELETYPVFKGVIVGAGLLANKVGIRGLLQDLNLTYGEISFSGFKISFDEFDEAEYQRLQSVAASKITRFNEETRKQIHQTLADGFKGELQPNGIAKYKSYQQIAQDIKKKLQISLLRLLKSISETGLSLWPSPRSVMHTRPHWSWRIMDGNLRNTGTIWGMPGFLMAV